MNIEKRRQKFMPDNVPKNVRCYDDGESADRYTVVFTGRYRHQTNGSFMYIGMNSYPFHPQGIGMHGESERQIDAPQGWAPAIGRKCHLGKRIAFKDLPLDCKICTMQTYMNLWGLTVP